MGAAVTVKPEQAAAFTKQVIIVARDRADEFDSLAHKLDRNDPLRPALIAARNNFRVAASELAHGLTRRQEASHVG